MSHTRREFIKTTTAGGVMFGATGASGLDALHPWPGNLP